LDCRPTTAARGTIPRTHEAPGNRPLRHSRWVTPGKIITRVPIQSLSPIKDTAADSGGMRRAPVLDLWTSCPKNYGIRPKMQICPHMRTSLHADRMLEQQLGDEGPWVPNFSQARAFWNAE